MAHPFGPEDFDLDFGDLEDQSATKQDLFDQFYALITADLINSRKLISIVEEMQRFELTNEEIEIVNSHLNYVQKHESDDIVLFRNKLILENKDLGGFANSNRIDTTSDDSSGDSYENSSFNQEY
jgi:hypothetical protein